MANKREGTLVVNAITKTGRKVCISGNVTIEPRDDYPFSFDAPIMLREVCGMYLMPKENMTEGKAHDDLA